MKDFPNGKFLYNSTIGETSGLYLYLDKVQNYRDEVVSEYSLQWYSKDYKLSYDEYYIAYGKIENGKKVYRKANNRNIIYNTKQELVEDIIKAIKEFAHINIKKEVIEAFVEF